MSVELLVSLLLVAAVIGSIFYFNARSRSMEPSSSDSSSSNSPSESSQPTAEISLRDPVTGLYNRNHLLRRLSENMARADRERQNIAVIMWDIDGFVGFNNKYGQKEGDRLLKRVAEIIRRSIRAYDQAFRSGPDEFFAILTSADEKVTRDVTERVGLFVSKGLFEGDAEYAEYEFSISCGYKFYPSEHKVPEALLYAVGQELYKVKHSKSVPS